MIKNEKYSFEPNEIKKLKKLSKHLERPVEIVTRMMEEQQRQGNPLNFEVFKVNEHANIRRGGFDWDASIEGDEFWKVVLYQGDYSEFYKRYPKGLKSSTNLKSSDSKFGSFEARAISSLAQHLNIPNGLAAIMVARQAGQGNKFDCQVFKKNIGAGRKEGGFDWDKTIEGWEFWEKTMNGKDFKLYYNRYEPTKVSMSSYDMSKKFKDRAAMSEGSTCAAFNKAFKANAKNEINEKKRVPISKPERDKRGTCRISGTARPTAIKSRLAGDPKRTWVKEAIIKTVEIKRGIRSWCNP